MNPTYIKLENLIPRIHCLICLQPYNTTIPLEHPLQAFGDVTLADALENLNFLEIPDAVKVSEALCGICTAKVQESFQLKIECYQNTTKLLSKVIKSEIKTEIECEIEFVDETLQIKKELSNHEIDEMVTNGTENKKRKGAFECLICHKAFARKQNVDRHLLVHTKEKNHICDRCGKAFARRSTLKRHQIVHTREKLYTCNVCHVSFNQRHYLTNHKITHAVEKHPNREQL